MNSRVIKLISKMETILECNGLLSEDMKIECNDICTNYKKVLLTELDEVVKTDNMVKM